MSHIPIRGMQQLRKGRRSIPGTYYFLTTTTLDRRPILSNSEVAQVIFETFDWLEAKGRAEWICIMVMPDHLHAVLQLGRNQTLSQVMHSLKTFTARQINKLLGQHGSLWHEGYYDHGIRSDESLNKIIRYCYENPVRQDLIEQAKDYPYWRCKFQLE